MCHRLIVSQFLLLGGLSALDGAQGAVEKLVMFAGPHRSASTSVEQFLYSAAAGHSTDDPDRKSKVGLKEWIWPHIDYGVAIESNETDVEVGDDRPFKLFGKFVTEPTNDLLQHEVLEGLRAASIIPGVKGMVLGTEWFDQVAGGGDDSSKALKFEQLIQEKIEEMDAEADHPLAHVAPHQYHNEGLTAMKKIVDYLEFHAEDVTVVINYRTPRLDQWASLWASHISRTSRGDLTAATENYTAWLCNPELYDDFISLLATQMNPLHAAEAYLAEGWKVKLIDMGGVEADNREVTHVISCDILTGECNDGQLFCHRTDNPHEEETSADLEDLSTSQKKDAEALFRNRDCAFERALTKNPNFEILYKDSIWSECSRSLINEQMYAILKEKASVMYMALLSQVRCPEWELPFERDHVVRMDMVLSGRIPNYTFTEMLPVKTVATKGRASQHKSHIGFEMFMFAMILIGSFVAQYARMVKSSHSEAGWMQVATSVEEAELSVLHPTDGLDAEFGEVGGVDDDPLPTTKKFKD
eukprot:Nitzschia sp. Nitz4//scaffold63_size106090//58301//59884//NITZ4_004394-RA/size106090-processed-gene-0.127-mRNA-1//1//CDS//3329555987//8248//frame0